MDLVIARFFADITGIFWLDIIGIFVAEYLPFLIVILAIPVFLKGGWRKVLFKTFFALLVIILSKGIIVDSIKFFLPKPRPDELLGIGLVEGVGSAFPSGHTAFVFSLSFFVYFLNKKKGRILLLLSVLVGLGRMYVGVHWFTDVLGGIVVGLLSFVVMYYLLRGELKALGLTIN